MNKFVGYRCSLCSEEYSPSEVTYTCPKDGGNLDVVLDYDAIKNKYRPEDLLSRTDPSLWRFLGIAYGRELFGLEQSISFTWVQPCSLAATIAAGVLLFPLDPRRSESFGPLVETLSAPATATRPATDKWQQIVDTVLVPMLQKAVAGGDSATLLAEAKAKVEGIVNP